VTVISTAMPTIVSRLGGFDLFTWAFGIYLLGQAVMTPIYGRLADQFGRRPVFLASTALFLVGSLLCGFAWSMPSLILFRAIQGFGGGGLVPLATTIIGDVCAPSDRPRVIGYVSGIWGIAAIAGPLIGSLCVGTVGWPWVFWVNLPIGAVTMVLVVTSFSEPARTVVAGDIDYAGSGLLALGIGAGMAALVQWDVFSARSLAALLGASALLLAGFGVRERRAAMPMLALHLLRRPVILAANLSALLLGALVIELTAFIPPAVQGGLGQSALTAGFVLGVMTLSWSTASMGFGRMLVRLPLRAVALAASALLVGGSALLLGSTGVLPMFVACIPFGFGLGTNSLIFTVAVQNAVTTADRGRATSLFYFSRMLGQAVGAAALGGVLNAGLRSGGPDMMSDLRSLMGAAGRAALPEGDVVRLLPVLHNALSGVFQCGLGIAALTVFVAVLARPYPSASTPAVIKP
jgi:predicted MFS family arabinose efflux permease